MRAGKLIEENPSCPTLTADDGVRLYYEEAGQGTPILFVHEFLGEYRSWEAQVRYFSRRYRCIAYNARGYPPSDVPEQVEDYSYEHQRAGIRAMLDALKIDKAHVVGLSMGAFATFYFGMKWPERALSLTLAGIGSGSMPEAPREVQAGIGSPGRAAARGWLGETAPNRCALSPTRVQLQNKNPRAFAEFVALVKQHSAKGSALTLKGYQALRPSLQDFKEQMARCTVPTLIISGDEDEPCLDASLMLKRAMPSSGLVVHAADRACLQPGGTRAVQPAVRAVLPPGRVRAVPDARPARAIRIACSEGQDARKRRWRVAAVSSVGTVRPYLCRHAGRQRMPAGTHLPSERVTSSNSSSTSNRRGMSCCR